MWGWLEHFHPFIFYHISLSSHRELESISVSQDRVVLPCPNCHFITGLTKRDKKPLTFTSTDILEGPLAWPPVCMFLGCGRKSEYTERTHAGTGRTWQLCTETPGHRIQESNPGPSCCEATVLTTAPLCWISQLSVCWTVVKDKGRSDSELPPGGCTTNLLKVM